MDLASYDAWYTSRKDAHDFNAQYAQDPAKLLAWYLDLHIQAGDYRADQSDLEEIKRKIMREFAISYEYTEHGAKVFAGIDELRRLADDTTLDITLRGDLLMPLYIETGDVRYAARTLEEVLDAPPLFSAIKDARFELIARHVLADAYCAAIGVGQVPSSKPTHPWFTRIAPDLIRAFRFQGVDHVIMRQLITNYPLFSQASVENLCDFARELRGAFESEFDPFLVAISNSSAARSRLLFDNLILGQVTTIDRLHAVLTSDAEARIRSLSGLANPAATSR
jgi:hypothetical protein